MVRGCHSLVARLLWIFALSTTLPTSLGWGTVVSSRRAILAGGVALVGLSPSLNEAAVASSSDRPPIPLPSSMSENDLSKLKGEKSNLVCAGQHTRRQDWVTSLYPGCTLLNKLVALDRLALSKESRKATFPSRYHSDNGSQPRSA